MFPQNFLCFAITISSELTLSIIYQCYVNKWWDYSLLHCHMCLGMVRFYSRFLSFLVFLWGKGWSFMAMGKWQTGTRLERWQYLVIDQAVWDIVCCLINGTLTIPQIYSFIYGSTAYSWGWEEGLEKTSWKLFGLLIPDYPAAASDFLMVAVRTIKEIVHQLEP